jgi:hypothetical protein
MRGAIVLVAMLLTGAASAQSPDISAQRLLSSWKGEDPMMSKLAEVIAAAFSSGLSWQGAVGGKQVWAFINATGESDLPKLAKNDQHRLLGDLATNHRQEPLQGTRSRLCADVQTLRLSWRDCRARRPSRPR